MASHRYETELFQEQLAEIRRRDKRAAEQIDAVLARIVSNPEGHDGQLKGDRSGRFKKKVVEKKYRVVFGSCQYCLRTKKKKCDECAERGANSVILEEVFLRQHGSE